MIGLVALVVRLALQAAAVFSPSAPTSSTVVAQNLIASHHLPPYLHPAPHSRAHHHTLERHRGGLIPPMMRCGSCLKVLGKGAR